eukprot:contig_2487_g479
MCAVVEQLGEGARLFEGSLLFSRPSFLLYLQTAPQREGVTQLNLPAANSRWDVRRRQPEPCTAQKRYNMITWNSRYRQP